MKKGIIMEMDDVFLTLLTPDGEFLRARKQNKAYVLGEEVHFFPAVARERTGGSFSIGKFFKGKRLATAAAALVLVCASFLPIYKSNQAYAYMSIDVNPSIEMAVNKEMQVVELNAFNKDGKRILTKIDDWKKEDVSKITENILIEIKKQGYLKSNHTVVISTVRTEKAEPEAEKQLNTKMQKIEEAVSNEHLQLTVVSGTEKDLENAHKMGVTTGKYKEIKNPAHFNKEVHEKNPVQKTEEHPQVKTKVKSILPSKPELKNDLKEDDEKGNKEKEGISKRNIPLTIKPLSPAKSKRQK
ncbi:anti-sigma factor domain-containing protein [Neobacillus sp. PS3-34]|uniref:anti-sigma factor domain-containing protein n=1 Tax=Neobacillus sp. PS3-34 TaxID=3070678 RepID=UPI0027E1130D|nr:anti-sigma factor domain-containing protein [Neobacillus sp. PS3-34]WML49465.1 anti-sigma factor domain-containing protein [Neobacillus sp. PS3-34]